MARDIIMGIDIGTSSIKTAIAEKRKNETLPYILGTGSSPSLGLRKGYIIDSREVGAAIKDSLKKARENTGISIKQAYVSVGGAGIDAVRSKGSIAVSRADHEISDADVKRSLSQCETQLRRTSSSYLLNRDIIHVFPIAYKIDDEPVMGNPVGMRGEKLEVDALFITILSQHLSGLEKSLEIAGISIEDVVVDSWATSHALLGKKDKEVGCILVNIGGDTSSLMVFEEGGPISHEILPIGSNHITYDIAQAFQVGLNEAEEFKLSYGKDIAIKKKLASVIEPRLKDIFEFVENHLDKIKRAKLLPGGIILTGGGSKLEGIDEIAKKSLQLPVKICRGEFPGAPKGSHADPSWSVALGLCLIGANESNIPSFGQDIMSKPKGKIAQFFKNFIP
ncbi:MAG: cell division protein FtsA [Candidatus Pacebacteria bacterium]|nr:cell division protein FtsA [Candidatus Paceibacterota bacterium]